MTATAGASKAPDGPPTRPHYREGQRLRAVDLRAEQAYRLRLRRSHGLGQHTWGIVQGLGLAVEPPGFTLQPGMAVDGYGRLLAVHQPQPIPLSVFDDRGAGQLDAWLLYRREPVTPGQRGAFACGPGRNSRWREEAGLCLSLALKGLPGPRQPPGVPGPDRDFPPYQPPPDDPDRRWPIYLGRLYREQEAGGGPPRADVTTRPYAGLLGEVVAAPSGRAAIRIGAQRGDDARPFVVSVVPAAANGQPGPVDRLAVDQQGRTTISGAASASDSVLLQAARPPMAAAADPQAPKAVRRLIVRPSPAADAAAPWTLSRTELHPPGAVARRQLRFEIGMPTNDVAPARHRLAIGTPGHDCLTVDAGCTVTVHGDLVVRGRLIEGPVPADPGDPRFEAAVVGTWAAGLSAAGGRVDTRYAGDLLVEIVSTGVPAPGSTWTYTVTVRNPGRAATTDIAVYEVVAIDEDVKRRQRLAQGVSLAPGARADYQTTFDVPAAGGQTITVGVNATGLGPALDPISRTGLLAVPITPVIP
jgi:hypothetical protein